MIAVHFTLSSLSPSFPFPTSTPSSVHITPHKSSNNSLHSFTRHKSETLSRTYSHSLRTLPLILSDLSFKMCWRKLSFCPRSWLFIDWKLTAIYMQHAVFEWCLSHCNKVTLLASSLWKDSAAQMSNSNSQHCTEVLASHRFQLQRLKRMGWGYLETHQIMLLKMKKAFLAFSMFSSTHLVANRFLLHKSPKHLPTPLQGSTHPSTHFFQIHLTELRTWPLTLIDPSSIGPVHAPSFSQPIIWGGYCCTVYTSRHRKCL